MSERKTTTFIDIMLEADEFLAKLDGYREGREEEWDGLTEWIREQGVTDAEKFASAPRADALGAGVAIGFILATRYAERDA
jgi:hypothetical protein